MNIAGREIGKDQPPYIVAELSCNHDGSIYKAFALIDAAANAGADAVKLQTYKPDDLTNRGSPLWNLYEKAQTPREWHKALFNRAAQRGIACFSSPFSVEAVEFLETFDPPAYKIASPEITQAALIEAIKHTGKPLIVSCGMATYTEVIPFIQVPNTVLLHCVSHYPARIEDANLKAIRTLAEYNLAGLSDHTPGYETAIAATALGAVMIEKHIKLDDDCIDAAYSLDPDQFKAMREAVTAIWLGMGDGVLRRTCEPRRRAA